MADKVTFDFENGIIEFDTPVQRGIERYPDLAEKREAIMAAAGYETVDMTDFRKEVNAMFRDLGFNGIVCDGSDAEDIAAAEGSSNTN